MIVVKVSILSLIYYFIRIARQTILLGPNIDKLNDFDEFVFNIQPIVTKAKTVYTQFEWLLKDVEYKEKNSRPKRLKTTLSVLEQEKNKQVFLYCSSPGGLNDTLEAILDQNNYMASSRAKVQRFAKWLEDNFHVKWHFYKAIRNAIGVHHGKIPRALSSYVTYLFDENQLNLILCTSTLVEGINSNAEVIILHDNTRSRRAFDYFAFQNISGRAGRMTQHYIGKVYHYFEQPRDDETQVNVPALSQEGEDVSQRLLFQIEESRLSPNGRKQRNAKLPEMEKRIPIQLIKQTPSSSLSDLEWLYDHFSKYGLNSPILSLANFSVPSKEVLGNFFRTCKEPLATTTRMHRYLSQDENYPYWITRYMTQYRYHMRQANTKDFIGNLLNYKSHGHEVTLECIFNFISSFVDFTLPNFISTVQSVVEHLFPDEEYDFSPFINELEMHFMPPFIKSLEEYGLPIQIGFKFKDSLIKAESVKQAVTIIKLQRPKVDLQGAEIDIYDFFIAGT